MNNLALHESQNIDNNDSFFEDVTFEHFKTHITSVPLICLTGLFIHEI